jgi:hypothetical protein
MGWFRMWDDILDSVKLHRLPAETAWAWVRLLGAANRHDFDGGTLPDLDTLSFWLRVTPQDAGRMIDDCLRAGLLDSEDGDVMVIHDWRHWQRPKDATTANRSKKYRDAKRDASRRSKRDARVTRTVTPTVTVTGEEEEEDGKTKKNKRAARAALADTNRIDEGPPEWQHVVLKAQELWGTRRFPELLRESYGSSPNANGALMHWWDMGTPEAFRQALVDLRAKPDNEHTLDRYCAFVRREINRPTSARLHQADDDAAAMERERLDCIRAEEEHARRTKAGA